MYAIIGLGNPGVKYLKTRHNLGFMLLDQMAKQWHKQFNHESKSYEQLKRRVAGKNVLFIKPLTFMNLSGLAVRKMTGLYDVPFSKLLIICDDFNLPLGKIRIRKKGSDGGHNGLASIIEKLETNNIPRLRLGIGLPDKRDVVDFVLSPFEEYEWDSVTQMLDKAEKAVKDFIKNGIDYTMNTYNS